MKISIIISNDIKAAVETQSRGIKENSAKQAGCFAEGFCFDSQRCENITKNGFHLRIKILHKMPNWENICTKLSKNSCHYFEPLAIPFLPNGPLCQWLPLDITYIKPLFFWSFFPRTQTASKFKFFCNCENRFWTIENHRFSLNIHSKHIKIEFLSCCRLL